MTDQGSSAAELPACVIALVALLNLVVGAVRYVDAMGTANDASADAARAAAAERAPETSDAAGTAAAARTLNREGDTCAGSTVTVDSSRFRPGGAVTATVRCTVSFADLGFLPFPGSITTTSTFSYVVPSHRGRAP